MRRFVLVMSTDAKKIEKTLATCQWHAKPNLGAFFGRGLPPRRLFALDL